MVWGMQIRRKDFDLHVSPKAADLMMRDIAKDAAAEASKNIRKQKSPDGVPFIPLSQRRLAQKKAAGQSSQALDATGRLKRNIHARRVAAASYLVSVKQTLRYKTGKADSGRLTGDKLAKIHQIEGAGSGEVVRPFIGWTELLGAKAQKRITRFLKARLKIKNTRTLY